MTDEHVRLERDGAVATLTLCRPDKLNAWSWEATDELCAHAAALRFDRDVRAVVLRAEGRAFCAGVDLAKVGTRVHGRSAAETIDAYHENFRELHERFSAVAALPQPVIAAVQGYCLGAGMEIATLADIRIGADDAVFALPEVTIGVGIDGGADMRLAAIVGPANAKLLALTGRRVDAANALRLGLCQEVVPAQELWTAAAALAREIAANAPLAVQSVKRQIDFFANRGMADALRYEALSVSMGFVSEDLREGGSAKAERRPPEFEGK
ncbi:MAG: enoyl-CoA hydratase/isomerase family protein [Acidimicrobiia bacterium]|nr:enoyl-CoA hydratase/isomerase family protein [Acidimicrobiia bacterium]